MQKKFQDWIIAQHEMMKPEEKRQFLKLLKENPESLTRMMEAHLLDWATMAAFDLGVILFSYDNGECAAALVKVFQEHFQEQLNII